MLYLTVLLFILCSPALALYDSSDDVIELNENNFNQVLASDGVWLVEFYAPWCIHCQNLAPDWKKVASTLKGVVNVAAVDTSQHSGLSQRYQIKGLPTILLFLENKQSPQPYQGSRSADVIVTEALRQVQSLVKSRLGGSSSGRGDGDDSVIELTDSNFDEVVMNSEENWLVEFFAPWCGHCKNLKPHWDQAARELEGRVKVGALDATVHTKMAARYGVRGYPTIKFFPAGVKSGDPLEYSGGRTADDIVRWASDQAVASLPPPEVFQLTSANILKSACEEHQVCIIAVLPVLLDCTASCRNSHLDMLKSEAEKFKRQNWGWVWSEAMQHPDAEKALDIGGFGYPAMAAVHHRKMKYTTMRGPFTSSGVHAFLRDLSLGGAKLPLFDLKELPPIKSVEPWSGEDAVAEDEEEEIDLNELGIKIEL